MGIKADVFRFPESIPEEKLLNEIRKLNESEIDGNNVDFDVSIVVEQKSSGKVGGKVGASILNVVSANVDSKLDQSDSRQSVNPLQFKVWVSENEMK